MYDHTAETQTQLLEDEPGALLSTILVQHCSVPAGQTQHWSEWAEGKVGSSIDTIQGV